MRVAAVVLLLALTGPSAGALVCDWACAMKHDHAAPSDCHDHDGRSSSATIAATDSCHELAATIDGVLTGVPQAEPRVLALSVSLPTAPSTSSLLLISVRSSGPPHAPPRLPLPLRI